MTVTRHDPPTLPPPAPGLNSQIIRVDLGVASLYRFSGFGPVTVGSDAAPHSVQEQLAAAYGNVDAALAAIECGWGDVIHLYVFTTDIEAYLAAEQAIALPRFGAAPPASTVLEVSRLVEPAWLVELQADVVGSTGAVATT